MYFIIFIIFITKLFFNKTEIKRKIGKIGNSYNNRQSKSKYVAYYVSSRFKTSRIERRILGEGIPFCFCGVNCLLPSCIEEYLTLIYEDYLQLPPEDKRVSHHDVIFSSLDTAYHPSMLKDILTKK